MDERQIDEFIFARTNKDGTESYYFKMCVGGYVCTRVIGQDLDAAREFVKRYSDKYYTIERLRKELHHELRSLPRAGTRYSSKNKPNVTCSECGKDFYVYPAYAKRTRKKRFCSDCWTRKKEKKHDTD